MKPFDNMLQRQSGKRMKASALQNSEERSACSTVHAYSHIHKSEQVLRCPLHFFLSSVLHGLCFRVAESLKVGPFAGSLQLFLCYSQVPSLIPEEACNTPASGSVTI